MKKVLWITLLLAMALSVAGCGGNQGPTTDIKVIFTEFAFTPSEFTVPAGQEISVHAVNNGAVIHEFVIMKQGTRMTEEFSAPDEENVFWRIQTGVGQEAEGIFTAPSEPGDYQIICGIPGHYASGMLGTLHVVAP